MPMETKPCVVCEKDLSPVLGSWLDYQPIGGGEICIRFDYGSRKDGDRYQGIICDECAEVLISKMHQTGGLNWSVSYGGISRV